MDTQALVRQRQQELDKIYNPQIDLINQQMQAIPGQFQGQRSSLEQAKTNAFRDITQTANRRGMFFSGFQPQEQARYLGEQFLPGLQNLTAQENQARMGLMQQLTGLRGQRAEELSGFQEQLRQERIARQEREEDFRREQQMQRERLAAQRAAAARSSAASAPTRQERLEGYSVERKGDGNGFRFRAPDGRPMSMVEYATATGTGLEDMLRSSDSDYDKRALQRIQQMRYVGTPDERWEPILKRDFPLLF